MATSAVTCGVPSCTASALNAMAGEYSCGARSTLARPHKILDCTLTIPAIALLAVRYLMNSMSERDACVTIAVTDHPDDCGACDPRTPPEPPQLPSLPPTPPAMPSPPSPPLPSAPPPPLPPACYEFDALADMELETQAGAPASPLDALGVMLGEAPVEACCAACLGEDLCIGFVVFEGICYFKTGPKVLISMAQRVSYARRESPPPPSPPRLPPSPPAPPSIPPCFDATLTLYGWAARLNGLLECSYFTSVPSDCTAIPGTQCTACCACIASGIGCPPPPPPLTPSLDTELVETVDSLRLLLRLWSLVAASAPLHVLLPSRAHWRLGGEGPLVIEPPLRNVSLSGEPLWSTPSGEDGSERGTLLDGEGASRLFVVRSGATLSLTDLSLRNGYAGDADGGNGGAALVFGGSLQLRRVSLSNCHATIRGGALSAEEGASISLEDVDAVDTSAVSGGFAFASASVLTLHRVVAEHSTAIGIRLDWAGGWANEGGGLIATSLSELRLTSCRVSHVHANPYGGLLYAYGVSSVEIADLVVENASAALHAGVLAVTHSDARVTGMRVLDCRSDEGALAHPYSSLLTLTDVHVSSAAATSSGGLVSAEVRPNEPQIAWALPSSAALYPAPPPPPPTSLRLTSRLGSPPPSPSPT